MFYSLLVGLPVMLLCLVLQAVFLIVCLRRYMRFRQIQPQSDQPLHDILLLALIMLLLLLGNFLQMTVWAGLFVLLGEFDSFATALYFSGVSFTTLGYGDIVLSAQWRLLGPLEAANGILMFGVSTAAMTATVMDMLKHSRLNTPAITDSNNQSTQP
jgi:hypothetical protein